MTSETASSKGGEGGLSLLAVMITLMLIVILALVAASLISVRSNITSENVNSKKAFYIAEAGLSVAKYILRDNWSNGADPTTGFPKTSPFAGGTFDAEVVGGADPNSEATVTVTGTYADSRRVIQAVVSRYSDALKSAIYTNGNCDLSGNVEINGNVAYGGTYTEGGNVNVTGNIEQIDQQLPGLDTDAAIAGARANLLNGYASRPDGNYFQGDFNPDPDSLNGVIFIDAYPDGNPANVQIAGNPRTEDGDGKPAFLIVMGNLRISGNVEYHGLIYTSGSADIDITLLGNMSIDGALITSGTVTMRGNANIAYNPDMVTTPLITDLLQGEDTPQETSWKEISP